MLHKRSWRFKRQPTFNNKQENTSQLGSAYSDESSTDWEGDREKQPEFSRSFKNEKPLKEDRNKEDFILISGNANIPLAKKIAKHLGVRKYFLP